MRIEEMRIEDLKMTPYQFLQLCRESTDEDELKNFVQVVINDHDLHTINLIIHTLLSNVSVSEKDWIRLFYHAQRRGNVYVSVRINRLNKCSEEIFEIVLKNTKIRIDNRSTIIQHPRCPIKILSRIIRYSKRWDDICAVCSNPSISAPLLLKIFNLKNLDPDLKTMAIEHPSFPEEYKVQFLMES